MDSSTTATTDSENMHEKKHPGDKASPITLFAIDGSTFSLEAMRGQRYMLSFFRFAACPFCNLRMHQLVSHYSQLGENFSIVAIFHSPLDNLQRYVSGHDALFPVLADEEARYYREYAIERSISGVLKGMVTRMPTLIKAMTKGYLPTRIKGDMTIMPADFLVDERGIIRTAYYGKDEGDHLPFDQVKAFALNESL